MLNAPIRLHIAPLRLLQAAFFYPYSSNVLAQVLLLEVVGGLYVAQAIEHGSEQAFTADLRVFIAIEWTRHQHVIV